MNQLILATGLLATSLLVRGAHAEWSFSTKPKSPAPSTAVLDLCQVPAPETGGAASVRQRLVLFDLGGEAVTNAPEQEVDKNGKPMQGVEHRVFQRAGIHDHLRNVFFGTFPMERFHTVAAQVSAPASLLGKSSIPHEDMIRAAELDPFAGYSIACADWVMFPRVSKKSASWSKVVRERKVGKRTEKVQVWELSNAFEFAIDVYRFDGRSWGLVATVEEGAGLVGTAAVLTSLGQTLNDVMGALGDDQLEAGPLSAAPELTCRVPLVDDLQDIADHYGKCGEATLTATSRASEALKLHPEVDPEEENGPADDDSADDDSAEKDPTADASNSDDTREGSADEASGRDSTDAAAEKNDDDQPKKTTDKAGAADEDTSEGSKAAEEAAAGEAVDESTENLEDEEPPEPSLDDLTRDALESASNSNPRRGIEGLVKQQVGEHTPKGVAEAVGAAKVAASTCKAGVDAVIDASAKLRALATQSPMATAKQAALGFAACAGIPLTYDLGNATPPGTTQMRSEHCKNLDQRSDVRRGFMAMQDVAVCVARVSGEHTTVNVQNEIKPLPGIRLEAVLQALTPPQPNLFGLAVGKTLGVKRGAMFIARAADGSDLGFGYIIRQHEGQPDLSEFRFRAGDAPLGTNMEEHPKIGFLLGGRPQLGLILNKQDLASETLIGGAVEGGYNAGQFVAVGDEFWVRTNIAYVVGREDESFIVIEFVPEAQYYLFSRVAAFVQSGVGMTIGSKKLPGAVPELDVDLNGHAFSVLLGVGLDVAVTPDWNTRLAVTGNQGITELTLKDESELVSIEGGRLTTVQGTVSVDYSF